MYDNRWCPQLARLPVRTDITGTKQIIISHVCYADESESEELLADKTLSQVCYIDEDKSKIIICDESSTEESES